MKRQYLSRALAGVALAAAFAAPVAFGQNPAELMPAPYASRGGLSAAPAWAASPSDAPNPLPRTMRLPKVESLPVVPQESLAAAPLASPYSAAPSIPSNAPLASPYAAPYVAPRAAPYTVPNAAPNTATFATAVVAADGSVGPALPAAPAASPALSSPEVLPASATMALAPTDEAEYFTMPELRAEMAKLAWKKGDYTITPYAWLWASTSYETERTNNGDYTFYVYSAQDQGEPDYHVNARSTRLGFDVAGPRIACLGCAQTGGKVEFDFEGQFVQQNKGSVLLRHAYWEAKTDRWRLLAGQTWDVVSPLIPNSIMYSVYWGAGNIGYRRAQFRGERYFDISDNLLWTVQGSINSDIVSEFPSGANTGFAGDHSSWPVLEGRTALSFGPRGANCNPIVLGVSGHVGQQVFDFTLPPPHDDAYINTWSFNVDLKAPVTDRFGFQGELYCGSNLGAYLGGILQGVDIVQREGIYDQGGWMEVYYYWTPKFHSHFGYTLDDPLNSDLSLGTARTYNQAYWGNVVYDITKQFIIGLEVSQWRTLYLDREPGEATRIEFMAKYCF